MPELDLSIVIPCYNEVALLAHSVDEIVAVMRATPLRYELIFVDDASRDRTVALIEEVRRGHADVPSQLLTHATNTGRGRTATDGFRLAGGRIVGYLDIDLEVHARYIPAMVDAIERQGYDAAIAWRIYQASSTGVIRALSSKGYHALVKQALGLDYQDTETGFKFFRRDALARIIDRPQHPGWFWDTEIMVYCAREGLRVAEIPCVFMRRSDKVSSVRLVRDTIEYLRSLWALKRRLNAEQR
jgi:dolichyl-phosphate beta-glucosyltransferase